MSFAANTGQEKIIVDVKDGYKLKSLLYKPNNKEASANIIVAGATGVPQNFYKRFAIYASDHGYNVYTFDFRGIGLSKPKTLKGFEANFLDWACHDLASVVDFVSKENDKPIFIVGHSYGGQALGLIPNHEKVSKLVTFATGAGWGGWMPLNERIKVFFLWNFFAPIIVFFKGYLAWSIIGMGADIPKGVYTQWRRWCRYPNYFFGDPEMKGLKEKYSKVNTSIFALNSIDDGWAPPKSRDSFMKAYINSKLETKDLIPSNYDMKNIGHINYFRPEAKKLWSETLDWLSK